MHRDGKPKQTQALVVVAKAPLEGRVKTRLCPYLSPGEAAVLYECLLSDIVAKMEEYQASELWLAFAPEGEEYFRRTYPETRLLAQRGKDLGERLHSIFVDLFGEGYERIVVADSDSPAVPLSSIGEAYANLNEEKCDVVLGPSTDGGYYLIGLKRPTEGLLDDIPWSTDGVLMRTLEKAGELGLRTALLPPAYDIDIEEDLRRLWKDFLTSRELRERAPRTYAYLTNLFGKQFSRDFRLDPLPRGEGG